MTRSGDIAAEARARHERLSSLFLEACERAPDERDAFLSERCPDDTDLRRQVLQLLAHDGDDAAIDQPVIGRIDPSSPLPPPRGDQRSDRFRPARLGRYEILGVLGEGGMGTVYRARQENPDRIVALKVIRPGIASESMIRRFELEAKLLGRLQHPGIAQIHEAGSADSGFGVQPYFAMELVEGRPLPDFAETRHLGLRERLDLVARICDAVHHAHQKGIVHRDLKPANIIVDETGQPRILDFGVARVTDADIKATTLHTGVGQLIGTLPYMSPEQVAGDPSEVDVRSDVYALGVIAYELLSGRLPHDMTGRTMLDAARAIQTEPPPRLSSVSRALRGDAETIVGKAMEKDRSLRYQSASELAADIRRFLADQPIVARPPSALYQFRKFTRRHRAVVAGAVVALALLVAAVMGTSYGLIVARAQRDEARRAADKAEAVRLFFLNVLTMPAPGVAGRGVTVVEALGRAESEVAAAFPDQPEVRGDVHAEMAVTFAKLGDYAKAEEHARESLRIRLETLGEAHRDTITSMNNLANILQQFGRRLQPGAAEEADALLDRAIGLLRVRYPSHPEYLVDPLSNKASLAFGMGRYDQAETLARELLEIARAAHGPDGKETLAARLNLAVLLNARDRSVEAERELKEVVDRLKATQGVRFPQTIEAQRMWAATLRELKRYDDAERVCAEVIPLAREVLGDDHPNTIAWLNDYGACLIGHAKNVEAVAAYREALAIAMRKLGEQDSLTVVIKDSLAQALAATGSFDESATLYGDIADPLRRQYGATSGVAVCNVFKRADALNNAGRASEALAICDALLSELGSTGNGDAASARNMINVIDVRTVRAKSLHALGKLEEAAQALEACLSDYRDAANRGNWVTQRALKAAVTLARSMDRPDLAASLQAFITPSETGAADGKADAKADAKADNK